MNGKNKLDFVVAVVVVSGGGALLKYIILILSQPLNQSLILLLDALIKIYWC